MRNWAAILTACIACLSVPAPASAGPALLFDSADGKVLYSEEPDSLWYPASLTKVMTAYVTFEAIKNGELKMDDMIPCSLVATLQPPSKVGLNVGAKLSVEQALKAIIIKSANDVTVMLAEAVAGSERAFVDRMNAAAKRLGMTRTHFVNTNGLPEPAQVTTARDLALLSRAVLKDYPQYANLWTLPDMRIGKKRLASHNALLKTYPGADGLKTGFTCDSGFNVIASASRDGRRLMAVVLGESSGNERAIRAASLLEHGFLNYGWKQLFNTTTLDTLPVDQSARPITSVREYVISWDCGNRKRRKSVAQRNKELKAKVTAVKARAKSKTEPAPAEPKASVDPEPTEEEETTFIPAYTASQLPLKGSVSPQVTIEPDPQAPKATLTSP